MSRRFGRLRGRGGREGANLVATCLLLLAALVGANRIADRRNLSWDTTTGERHSLAPQTTRILAGLDREVRLVVLDQPRAAGRTIELFESYADQSGFVDWEVIDPEAEPTRARAYQGATEAGIPFGTVVVVAGERQERVAVAQEQDLTNALVRLLRGKTKKVYFLTGHRERSLDETGAGGLSAIRSRLEESNYEVAELALLETVAGGAAQIPGDAAAVVVAGPLLDLLEAEARALSELVLGGGSVLLLLDPGEPPEGAGGQPTLFGIAEEFGVVPAGDVVIDGSGVGQLFGFGIEAPLAAGYGVHPITRGFENAATVFPLAQSLIGADPDDRPEGVRLAELVLTSESSWGERSAEELRSGEVAPGDEDLAGPLTLAWAVEVEADDTATETAGDTPTQPAGETPTQPTSDIATQPAGEIPTRPAGDTGTEPAGDTRNEPADDTRTEPADDTRTEATDDTRTKATDDTRTEPADDTRTEAAAGAGNGAAESGGTGAGRLVVVGDADFTSNNLALAPLGNADLFLNMVNWLTEDEDLIAIRPRSAEDRRITMTAAQLRNVVLFCLVFLPGFFLLWGVAVWWSRR